MHQKLLLFVLLLVTNTSYGQHIIAHRGASHDAPENTLPAFELAWEQQADGIEADFYLSSDGHIVCFHDRDTERVAGVKHIVSQTPYSVLKRLDVGAWKDPKFKGTTIPLCEDVLATVPDGKMIFIELKVGPEIVQPLSEVIERSSLKPAQMVIISFNEATIAECSKVLPRLKRHWLSSYQEKDGRLQPGAKTVAMILKQSNATGFGSKAVPEHFNGQFLQKLSDAGFQEFHVWTVDEPDVARFYQPLKPFSITTNRPGWLREQLQLKTAAR